MITLLDHFDHLGPNGTHHCLVFEAMGADAAAIVEGYRYPGPGSRYMPPYWMAKSFLRQVLLGLDFLHSRGIAHADLQWGNILFQATGLDSVSEDELFQKDGLKGPNRRHDGRNDPVAPKYLAETRSLEDYADLTHGLTVKISDLGGAFFFSQPPVKPATPLALRAPALVLGGPISRTQDVWSLGCLIFELITGTPLLAVARGWSNIDAMIAALPPEAENEPKTKEAQDPISTNANGTNGPQNPVDASNPETIADEQNHLLGQKSRLELELQKNEVPHRPADDRVGEQQTKEIEEQPKANPLVNLTVDEEADDEHLTQLIALLGPLPANLQSRWKRYSLYFDEHGNTDDPRFGNEKPTEECPRMLSLAEMVDEEIPSHIPSEEKAMINNLLHSILQYEPAQRPSVSEVLNHPWFGEQDLKALVELDDWMWKDPSLYRGDHSDDE